MKRIKYICFIGGGFHTVVMDWNEINEKIAKREAVNGEYTVIDDYKPEPTVEPTPQDDTDAILVDLEYRLTLLELGVFE